MTEELADIRRRVATKAQQCLQTWPRGSPAPPRALVVLRTCYLVAQLACATAAGADPHVDDVDEVVLRAVTLAFADEIQALQQAIQVWLSQDTPEVVADLVRTVFIEGRSVSP